MSIYDKKTTAALKLITQKHINEYVRMRDKDQPCISCGNFRTLQAGHFIAQGSCSGLRYNLDNIHGQCLQCNYHKGGDYGNYRTNLIHKIGLDKVETLEFKRDWFKQTLHKWDRFSLIEIIEKAKHLKLIKKL